jgi:hypothetical protein
MTEVYDISVMRQFVAAYDGHQQRLAEGAQALAQQEAQKAEHEAILQAQATEIEANRLLIAEQHKELAALGHALMTADAEGLTLDPPVDLTGISGNPENIWLFRERLEYEISHLRGWLGVQGALISVSRLAHVISHTADALERMLQRLSPTPVSSPAPQVGGVQPWR